MKPKGPMRHCQAETMASDAPDLMKDMTINCTRGQDSSRPHRNTLGSNT